MTVSKITHDSEMSVNWGDCDAAGISYYAKNFEWYTNGYMQLLASYGFPYMETFHAEGISLVCLKAETQYKRMLRPLEHITLRTSLTELTRTRMTFSYQLIKKNGEMASWGTTSHAYVDNEGFPMNIKKHHPTLWESMTGKWEEVIDFKRNIK
jgi:acyl-CoA thioester hydrolase